MNLLRFLPATPLEAYLGLVNQREALHGGIVVPSFDDASAWTLRTRVTNQVDGIRDTVAHPGGSR